MNLRHIPPINTSDCIIEMEAAEAVYEDCSGGDTYAHIYEEALDTTFNNEAIRGKSSPKASEPLTAAENIEPDVVIQSAAQQYEEIDYHLPSSRTGIEIAQVRKFKASPPTIGVRDAYETLEHIPARIAVLPEGQERERK